MFAGQHEELDTMGIEHGHIAGLPGALEIFCQRFHSDRLRVRIHTRLIARISITVDLDRCVPVSCYLR